MTAPVPTPPLLPTHRRRIFDPPPELAALRDEAGPVCPVRLADGGEGWLVTGHAASRAVLTDDRFSARPELRRTPPGVPVPEPAAPGFFVRMDAPHHPRYRRLVSRWFTRRRLAALVPVIEAVTAERIDALLAAGPPADLVELWAMPIPSLVIGEILGVPPEERDAFAADSRAAVDLRHDPAVVSAAIGAIHRRLAATVAARAHRPGDDLISELLGSGLDADEVAAMAFLLLVAGHETTSNMLALGVFALLCHPAALRSFAATLDDDPTVEQTGLAAGVEELLRVITVNQFGAMRVAREDAVLGGCTVRAGDPVIVSLPAANRDPVVYPDPDRLAPERMVPGTDRGGQSHLAFGHGPHLCSGAQLARLELRIGYAQLLRRLPGLELGVAPQQVPLRLSSSVYGVDRLPVRW